MEARDFALFRLGFRPFFFGAGLFAVASMAMWAGIYRGQLTLSLTHMSVLQWHAHEMLYGYAMAVIAGFLLTAVRNWTSIDTLTGKPLVALFGLWLLPRLLFLVGDAWLPLAAALDLLFLVVLAVAVARPIVQVKQWRQMAVLSKLVLLGVCNALFYLAAFDIYAGGFAWGLYGGLYLVVGLILTMARRVMPMFIQNGVDGSVTLFNSRLLDLSSLILFLAFFLSELLLNTPVISAWLALGVFGVNTIRLIGWHTPGIWRKSLLWGLYLAYAFICLGFALFASIHFFGVSKFIAIHAMSMGGIGMMTLAMMCRVAIGHTGRDLKAPPKGVAIALALLLVGVVCRVILPLVSPAHYVAWVGVSQLAWIMAFSVFAVTYCPILSQPRIDGRPG